ncbi:MAG: hypothetical protein ABFQ89_03720 [Chloroflexota bacterium]
MTKQNYTDIKIWLLIAATTLLIVSYGCVGSSETDFPVTVIEPDPATEAWPDLDLDTPTAIWENVTLLPPKEEVQVTKPAVETATGVVEDPFTNEHSDILTPGAPPYQLNDAEISLGRILLPINLGAISGPFRVASIEVQDQPGWRFLAFDVPLPLGVELGSVVRAPFGGQVLAGSMRMINDQLVSTINIDRPIEDNKVIRAAFVYSGTIEFLVTPPQTVETGDAIFRVTRDTGRVSTLGNTSIPGGATFTLHASIDEMEKSEDGMETLSFLRGVSLMPSGWLTDAEGRIISPAE